MHAARTLLLVLLVGAGLGLPGPASAAPVKLFEQAPVTIREVAPGVVLVDFGRVAFGNVAPPAAGRRGERDGPLRGEARRGPGRPEAAGNRALRARGGRPREGKDARGRPPGRPEEHRAPCGGAHAGGVGRGAALPLDRAGGLAGRPPSGARQPAGGVRRDVGRRGGDVLLVGPRPRPRLRAVPLLDQGHDVRRGLRGRRPRADRVRGGRVPQPALPLRGGPRRADGARHLRPPGGLPHLADRVGLAHGLHRARGLRADRRPRVASPPATSRCSPGSCSTVRAPTGCS